jgi:hypothetical protein
MSYLNDGLADKMIATMISRARKKKPTKENMTGGVKNQQVYSKHTLKTEIDQRGIHDGTTYRK